MQRFKELFYFTLLLIILLATALFIYCLITNGHNWGDDFASYIMQAKSIVEGNPYEFISKNSFTIQNSTKILGPNAYPWGFPILLAPVYAFFGFNIIALKIVGAISLLSFIYLLWIGFKNYHSNLWRMLLVAFFAFNPVLLTEVNEIQSDLPFLFVSTLTVLLIGKIKIEKRYIYSQLADHILLGTLILIASLIRTNGILLLITVSILDLILLAKTIYKKEIHINYDIRRNVYSVCSIYALFFIVYVSISCFLPEGGLSHAKFLNIISTERTIANFYYYINLPINFFAHVPYRVLVYFISIPIAIYGIATFYKDRYHILIYLFLTFTLYVFWPPTQGLRFIFPILPFYISFVLSGLERSEQFFKKTLIIRAALILPIIIIIGFFLKYTVVFSSYNLRQDRYLSYGILSNESKDIFSYIEKNIPDNMVTAFFKPRAMTMMTNNTALAIHNTNNLKKVDYVCLYFPGYQVENQIPLNEINKLVSFNRAKQIYSNKEFRLYKLIK